MDDNEVKFNGIPNTRVDAPWTIEEVENLNEYQACPGVHPFTWPVGEGESVNLIATRDGWVTEPGGVVVQDWAHDFMMDGSMVKSHERIRKLARELSGEKEERERGMER